MFAARFYTPAGHDQPSVDHPCEVKVVEESVPEYSAREVLIKVAAAGMNQADTHQRAGNYPPPEGASEIPGLEVAGTIEAVGAQAGHWDFGTPVCALLAGGGYAEYVAVDARQLLPLPENTSMTQTAGLVEVAATVWANVWMQGGAQPGDVVLIHGGTGGIGEFAIRAGLGLGLRPIATAGSESKCQAVQQMGAEAINYRSESFVDRVMELTDGHGADVILDTVGGAYVEDHVKAVASGGRVVTIGTQGGAKGTLNVMRLMAKQAWFTGTRLRSRTAEEKAEVLAGVQAHLWPLIADGRICVSEPEVFDLTDVAAAFDRFGDAERQGKIVLRMPEA
ncbi:NAD(P)H-quinone oxidoreductase [Auritidibacter sp. NML130574]|uniref:NAD(P)H-quinone oxidoreductase n=1 Tax=Auritidibacter sp. NML130574 TaxID=2170745 RepID=UPI000D725399|nr:NAD(P)H-quinone oxidoreductase [Auritidibacter sp. NML130574]AXR74141.1 NAD(P)H-quinone oxidoreductase [Auritidibacter sp. NML130574]